MMDKEHNAVESNLSLWNVHETMPEVSDSYSNGLEHYVIMALLIILSATGTLGNSIVIYVFLRKRDRLVSTHFILVLAFVDFITCVVVIPYTIIMEYIHLQIKYDVLCKIYHFLLTSNIPFSAFIMVAIAIDRYLCICHPFLRTLSLPRAKFMTVSLAILAITIGIIVALMHGVYIESSVWQLLHAAALEQDSLMNHLNMSGDYLYQNGEIYYQTETIESGLEMSYSNYGRENDSERIVLYTGECYINTLIFGDKFQFYYQKLYTAMYLLCLVIVIILYTLIYYSVLQRRTKRERQRSQVLYLVRNGNDTPCGASEDTLITITNAENNRPAETSLTVKVPTEVCGGNLLLQEHVSRTRPTRRRSTKRDRMHVANMRTAGMLFVVTLVFIVTFLPAFLMTNEVIPYNMVVFYMYFANNVANPVIYSFMNKNFRDNLTKLFCK